MSTPDGSTVQPYTSEDLRSLARFMGWEEYDAGTGDGFWSVATDAEGRPWLLVTSAQDGEDAEYWSPTVSADADFQVLQRAREVWGIKTKTDLVEGFHSPWGRYCRALPRFTSDYTVGSFACAALAVLRSMPEGERR